MSSPASPDSPVTFALIGCGSIAPTQAKALARIPDRVRLTHCCDSDVDKAAKFAAEYGLRAASWTDILADDSIEAVTLCVPSGMHTDLAVEALRAGKHVITEKPMDASLEACDRLIAALNGSDRKYSVICQHRFDPASQKIRGLIEQAALGRLVLVETAIPWFRTQDYYDSGDWRGTWALDGGGCLMNQGVHTVDLMLWLCGPVKTVYARAKTAAHERIEVEDVVTATLEFSSGAIGTLMASTSCYPGFLARLSLFGTQGTAVIEGDELKTLALRDREIVSEGRGTAHALQVATGGTRSATAHSNPIPEPTAGWSWGDAHREQFIDFAECIRHDRAPLVDAVSGRAAVALIKAVYESSRTGLPVSP